MLTGDAFERARAYLFEFGRPLDRERFRFHFESGPAAAVLAELAAYQNGDGGFGHGLEADIRVDASSPIATAMAFRILREIGVPDSEVARGGLAYFTTTFDRVRSAWGMVPPAVEDAPHAPWWTYAEIEKTFAGCLVNPTAEILGALYDYAGQVPADLLNDLTPVVAARAAAEPQSIVHDLFVALLRLAEAANLPEATREPLRSKLADAAPHSVALEPSRWLDYTLQPLEALGRPDSFLAPAIPTGVVEANLEHWIDAQLPDGSWPLTWEWAEVDADAWDQAERDWKGKLIVDKLVTLRAFNQL